MALREGFKIEQIDFQSSQFFRKVLLVVVVKKYTQMFLPAAKAVLFLSRE